jgi:L-fucose isomerase-like protein
VKGLKNLRIGSIGARPTAFNTVRYSERIWRPAASPSRRIDLSEIFGRINKMKDNDDAAQAKLAAIKSYVTTAGITDAALLKMAKLGAVIDGWMKQANVTISAVQCWTSMEEFFGVVPCTIMSMMSNNLIPSACEVDVPGTLSMYMLALASGTPSALLDWNNNYGSHPDKCVCFHCSNLPKHFFKEKASAWTTRRSLPARWARRTPSAPAWAASRPAP